MRALLCVVALAACDDGIVLEIHPAPGTHPATVDIYMGLDRCVLAGTDTPCPGIGPPGVGTLLPGDVFNRDSDVTYTIPTDSDGVARLKLLPSGGNAWLPVVVAVDDTWSQAAIAVDIDTSKTGKRRMDLAKSTGLLGTQQADGTYLQIWAESKKPDVRCLGFEYWSSNGDHSRNLTRYFVVPREDPDCDERVDRMTGECNPLAFNGSSVPSFEDSTCFTLARAPNGALEEVCKLGGTLCIDGVPNTDSDCTPSNYCVPTAVCSSCVGAQGEIAIRNCLAMSAANPQQIPHIECTLPVQKSSDNTHLDRCNDNYASFEAKTQFHHCLPAPILFAKPDMTDPKFRFEDQITIASSNNGEAHFEMRLEDENNCTYKTIWDGELPLSTPPVEPVLARFAVGLVGSPPQFLVLPIKFIVGDCTAEFGCKLALGATGTTNPDLFRCAPPL